MILEMWILEVNKGFWKVCNSQENKKWYIFLFLIIYMISQIASYDSVLSFHYVVGHELSWRILQNWEPNS